MAQVSFIVPAHNEEVLLGATLGSIQNASRSIEEPIEIIVVDDASTDSTVAVARSCGARIVSVDRRQIAAARNAGSREATGDWLIFVDADTRINKVLLDATLSALKTGAIGGGCRISFDGRLPLYARALIGVLEPIYGRLGFAAGCFFFCTRAAFDAVGGFDESMYAAEEVVLSKALHNEGRFVILRETAITSGRKLRTYPAAQVLGGLLRLAIGGRAAFQRREGMELWYGERRNEKESKDHSDRLRGH
jgi:glycosyltransferase involved in cell wall biosynthesis